MLTLSATLYGCEQVSLLSGQDEQGDDVKKPETVSVNEGLSRQEERDLSKRLDELEKKVEAENQPNAQERPPDEQHSPSQDPEPTSGYNLVETPDGALSLEVPQSWGVETGEDSEKEAGPNTWSYHAGEYLPSSVTTAPNLDVWYTSGSSGAYVVASKTLAREHTDHELTRSLMFANKAQNCTTGPTKDYERPPYSGTLQAWFGCSPDGADTYTVAAAPEGRECVVVIDARISDETYREAVEHLLDTFKLDCRRVSSEPLAVASDPATATATATATASASASPAASASAAATEDEDACPNWRVTPDGMQCSNLPDAIPNSAPPDYPNPSGPSRSTPPPSGGDDINCDEVNGPIRTPPGDPDNLDGDDDGWACE